MCYPAVVIYIPAVLGTCKVLSPQPRIVSYIPPKFHDVMTLSNCFSPSLAQDQIWSMV